MAGHQIAAGAAKRTIHKLNGQTGTKIWTADQFGDSKATGSGAFEMINYESGCGDGIILSGFNGKPGTDELSFKSYGNTGGGQAVVMHIPLTALKSNTAPTSEQVSWTSSFPGSATAKNAHCTASGSIPVLLWAEYEGKLGQGPCSFATMDSTGIVTVSPKSFSKYHGEGTDMQVDSTGTFAYITGQGKHLVTKKGYQGRLTKVNIEDGTRVWTKSYNGGGGNPSLIYNECWGIAVQNDGVVLSCGTGIENCDATTQSPKLFADCKAGLGDMRPGALARVAGVWQVLTIKAGFDGTLMWQQVMSHKPSQAPALNTPGWVADSSAGEWPIATSDGGIAIVTDQTMGVGLLKLKGTPWGASAPQGPVKPCVDNHAGVVSASGGAFSTCGALAPAGFKCDHLEYGATITSLCPKTCECKAPSCCAAPADAVLSLAQVDAILPENQWHEEPLVAQIEAEKDYSQGKLS